MTPSRATAAHPHQGLLDTFERLIDEEIAFLDGQIPAPASNWQYVAVLLSGRVLQLQRVILGSVRQGYAEELYPLARALLSSVVALVYIAHGRSPERWERKAIEYLTFGRKARRKLLKYLVHSRWLTAADAKAHDVASTAEEDEFLAHAKANGLEPLREGKDKRYWTGYDDRTLFEKMKVKRWYHHFYSPWSADAHAQASSLAPLSAQFQDRTFGIGPHARDPWFLLLACSEFGIQGLDQLNKMYRLGRKAEIVALYKRTIEEMNSARRSEAAAARKAAARQNSAES